MRWELDTEAGSLYITLTEEPVDHQEEMPDGVVVDLDARGRAVGIEVLSAWAPFDHAAIVGQYHLDQSDAESLDFLVLELLGTLNKAGGAASPLQVRSLPPPPSVTRVSTPFASVA